MTFSALNGDMPTKKMYLTRIRQRIVADELVRGKTGENGMGCSIWCTFDYYDHRRSAEETDTPEWIWHLNDSLFECMSIKKSQTWPLVFFDAIVPGSNLDMIKGPLLIFVLTRALTCFDHDKFPDIVSTINASIALWQRDDIGSDSWNKAARAAQSGALTALTALTAAWEAEAAEPARMALAVGTAAIMAARSAAEAARMALAVGTAVIMAARSAAEAARMAAETAEYDVFADRLLKLMQGVTPS